MGKGAYGVVHRVRIYGYVMCVGGWKGRRVCSYHRQCHLLLTGMLHMYTDDSPPTSPSILQARRKRDGKLYVIKTVSLSELGDVVRSLKTNRRQKSAVCVSNP